MKKKLISYFTASLLLCHYCFSQGKDEDHIKNLENQERLAIINGDTIKLAQLMWPNIIVQNPDNLIVSYQQIIDRIMQGKIKYSSFERVIEKISFTENVAIVMGKEIIKPAGATTHAGRTVIRRFTNIWMKKNSSWKIIARQATNISIE